jgi:hypothetical protein
LNCVKKAFLKITTGLFSTRSPLLSPSSEPLIDVDIHGVTVVVPEDGDIQPIELFKKTMALVVDQQGKYDAYQGQVPDRTFEAGECFPSPVKTESSLLNHYRNTG